jgi:uncharacterized protein YkwD
MVLRYATIVLAAAVLAVVVLSVSAVKPKKAEAATRTVTTCGGGTITLSAKEKRTLRLHNRERKSRGLERLCVHRKLTRAARDHSADMIRRDYLGHGRVEAWLEAYGYHRRDYGENIGGGSGARGRPRPTFERWMNSPTHRGNILDGRFRQIGIGIATGNWRGMGDYTIYTVDFGTRR